MPAWSPVNGRPVRFAPCFAGRQTHDEQGWRSIAEGGHRQAVVVAMSASRSPRIRPRRDTSALGSNALLMAGESPAKGAIFRFSIKKTGYAERRVAAIERACAI